MSISFKFPAIGVPPRLPFEVQSMIIKLIDDQPTLFSLCAANSYTYSEAIKNLYRHPTCDGLEQELDFLAALFFRPALGPLVCSYTVYPDLRRKKDCDRTTIQALLDQRTHLSTTQLLDLMWSLTCRALFLMVNLETLSFFVCEIQAVDSLLRTPFTFRLKELRWSPEFASQEQLHRFLQRQGSIKCLSLANFLSEKIPNKASESLISLRGYQKDIEFVLPSSPGITHLYWHSDPDPSIQTIYPRFLQLPLQKITHFRYDDQKPLVVFGDALESVNYLCLPRNLHTNWEVGHFTLMRNLLVLIVEYDATTSQDWGVDAAESLFDGVPSLQDVLFSASEYLGPGKYVRWMRHQDECHQVYWSDQSLERFFSPISDAGAASGPNWIDEGPFRAGDGDAPVYSDEIEASV